MADSVFAWASHALKGASPGDELATPPAPPRPTSPSAALARRSAVVITAGCVFLFLAGWVAVGATGAAPGAAGVMSRARVAFSARPLPAATATTTPATAAPAPAPTPCPTPPPLDWFEVGCSDFDTLIQAAAAGGPGTVAAARGVSVDAVPLYTARLPAGLPHGRVINAAVVGWHKEAPPPATVPVF